MIWDSKRAAKFGNVGNWHDSIFKTCGNFNAKVSFAVMRRRSVMKSPPPSPASVFLSFFFLTVDCDAGQCLPLSTQTPVWPSNKQQQPDMSALPSAAEPRVDFSFLFLYPTFTMRRRP